MNFLEIKVKLLKKMPYLLSFLQEYPLIEIKEEDAYTDFKNVYVSEKVLKEYGEEFVIAHEFLHILLKHNKRIQKFDLLANIAGDLVINEFLDSIGIHCKKKEEAIFIDNFEDALKTKFLLLKNRENFTLENVLEILKKNVTYFPNEKRISSHNKWKDENNKDTVNENVLLKEKGASSKKEEKDFFNKGWAYLPDSLLKELGKCNSPKTLKQVIREVYNFLNKIKNNKKIDIFNPYYESYALPTNIYRRKKEKNVKNILIGIDCSGSISEETLIKFLSFCGKDRDFNYTFIIIDDLIRGIYTQIDQVKIPTERSGTDFRPFFEYTLQMNKKEIISGIFFFSDCEAYFPDKWNCHKIPVWWITNNKLANPPFGKVLYYDTIF